MFKALLRDGVMTPGWISDSSFLAGYSAAQAVPGPLFTFAAYLGAAVTVPPEASPGRPLRSSQSSCRGFSR